MVGRSRMAVAGNEYLLSHRSGRPSESNVAIVLSAAAASSAGFVQQPFRLRLRPTWKSQPTSHRRLRREVCPLLPWNRVPRATSDAHASHLRPEDAHSAQLAL